MIIDVVLKFLRGDLLPDFHDYPWLYMYLSAAANLARFAAGWVTGAFQDLAGYAASWPLRWEPFFLIDRGISAALGTLTIWTVFSVGRRLADETVGAASAFLMAVCFLHVRDSHYGTTDATMVFLTVLAVALLLRAYDEDSARWFTYAGVAAGLAAGTKYNGLGLLLPIACAQMLAWLPDARRRAAKWPLVSAGLPFALLFLVCVPFVYLDWARFRAAMDLLLRSM